jgi:hypothetical protein
MTDAERASRGLTGATLNAVNAQNSFSANIGGMGGAGGIWGGGLGGGSVTGAHFTEYGPGVAGDQPGQATFFEPGRGLILFRVTFDINSSMGCRN